MAFEEFSGLICAELSEVQFDVPKADLEGVDQIQGFERNTLNPKPNSAADIFTMFKPIYGLKDVPRAWRKTLHHDSVQWMSCRQLH